MIKWPHVISCFKAIDIFYFNLSKKKYLKLIGILDIKLYVNAHNRPFLWARDLEQDINIKSVKIWLNMATCYILFWS